MKPIGPLDCDRIESHKLQLKTIHGSVCAIEHDTHIDNRSEPFENPYPDIRCVPKDEVEILEMITSSIFRVQIQDQEYALKIGRSEIKRAIGKLRGTCHANVLKLEGVVVDKQGKIMGMLTPYISGVLLCIITSATRSQKEKWKTQISSAMNFLHNEDTVWGDAKPDNIIINSGTDEPVLIDFEGGQTEGWVDEDLCDTLEGDQQALSRILTFVDDIPTSEDCN